MQGKAAGYESDWNCNFLEMTIDGAALRSYLGTKRSRAPTTVIPLKVQLLGKYIIDIARRPAVRIATKSSFKDF